MKEQKYVIIKNPNGTPKTFTDHTGLTRMLSPLGSEEDSRKIIIADEQEEYAIQKYIGIKQAGLIIKFSKSINMEGKMNLVSRKLTVTPNKTDAELKQDVENIRQRTIDTNKRKRAADARFIRAKAEADIAANQSIQDIKSVKEPIEEKLEEKVLELTAEITDVKRTPRVAADAIHDLESQGENDDGVEVTFQSLMKEDSKNLLEMAKRDLGLDLAKGMEKKKIAKNILLVLNKK